MIVRFILTVAWLSLSLLASAQLANDEACGAIPLGTLLPGTTLTLEGATNVGAQGTEQGWYNESEVSCRGRETWNNTVYYRFTLDRTLSGVAVTITPRQNGRPSLGRFNGILVATRQCEDLVYRDNRTGNWSPAPGNRCATQPGETLVLKDDCLISPGGNDAESIHRVFGSIVYLFIASDTDAEEGNFDIKVEPITPTYCDGCINGKETLVDGPPLPLKLATDGPTNLCPGESATLQVSTVAEATGYRFVNLDNNETLISRFPVLTTTTAGTYQAEAITDCTPYRSNPLTITKREPLVMPSIASNTNPTLCQGDSVQLSVPFQSGVRYQWNRAGLSLGESATETAYWVKESGSFTLSLTNECEEEVSEAIKVVVGGLPEVPVGADVVVCYGESATLTASSPTADFYQWYNESGEVLGQSQGEFIIDNARADQRVRVSAVIGSCESEVASMAVRVVALSDAAITADTTIIPLGTSLSLSVPWQPGYRYRWSPTESLSSDTVANPVATPEDNATYTVTITSSEGCQQSGTLAITVQKVLLIPNAFTPNGDGVNDTWVIGNLERFPGSQIQVFDRWGQVVLEATNYNQSWEGSFRGRALPEDTYFYRIRKNNNTPDRQGSLTIIR